MDWWPWLTVKQKKQLPKNELHFLSIEWFTGCRLAEDAWLKLHVWINELESVMLYLWSHRISLPCDCITRLDWDGDLFLQSCNWFTDDVTLNLRRDNDAFFCRDLEKLKLGITLTGTPLSFYTFIEFNFLCGLDKISPSFSDWLWTLLK